MPHRVFALDVLRFGAALVVVLYHYTFSGAATGVEISAFPELDGFTRYGYLGVDLFFMISGFVVLMSSWGREPGAFVSSRVARLYPAYWFAVTATAATTIALSGQPLEGGWLRYLVNLTMVQSALNVADVDVVYWTLFAELWFYAIVFALTIFGIRRGRICALLWVWLVLSYLLLSGVVPAGLADSLDLLVQSDYSHYFVAGMALYLVHRQGWSWQLVAILALALASALARGAQTATAVGERYGVAVSPAVVSGAIVAMFALMALVASGVLSPGGRRWMTVAGDLTYPLYLLHAQIGFMVLPELEPRLGRWLTLLLAIGTVAVIAYVTNAKVERPGARQLKQLCQRAGIGTPAGEVSMPGA